MYVNICVQNREYIIQTLERKGYCDVYEQMLEAYSLASLQTHALFVVFRNHKYVSAEVELGKETWDLGS